MEVILVLARIQMAFQQRHGEKDNSNSDQSEYDDNFDLRRGMLMVLVKVTRFKYLMYSLIPLYP